ncbi:hypothetical protein FVEG_14963 [Fusarium verticillioides 7600]|nr:hypothetical protein FVEG_14963 [Fusarium verticillioides 7600]XP_018745105.1 hypothetical protein FVEG_14963 [Fusarium verticillioides 7600]XP_018745106.1 hypothetical protein FVEG_14963 [Fusarium verticillioides 7600]EWG38913.1 hypothetical protein FVEG_14963 [Fusarium verticillioides 7600]EWG38914.1 hypothetical protein FVEG_14963 [Fusarium verticillioides 7600]EWG38915.1 hypothetical protein FVEG_14963 [Fusarium verticillioides 7600]
MSFHPRPDSVCMQRHHCGGMTYRLGEFTYSPTSITASIPWNSQTFVVVLFIIFTSLWSLLTHFPMQSLVALSNIPALLDALALASAGGSVLETLAMLVLALGEASGLVSAVDTVRLE